MTDFPILSYASTCEISTLSIHLKLKKVSISKPPCTDRYMGVPLELIIHKAEQHDYKWKGW